MARTQQQRREETVTRLLDAGIETIIDVGYAKASAAVIARRAGVSDGALFRHFPTMGDFMAATASEVMRRQLQRFADRVAELSEAQSLPAVLAVVRDITTSDTNAVLYELLVAARTDEKLRKAMRRQLDGYTTAIYETARTATGLQHLRDDEFRAAVTIVTNTFDGAALVRPVLRQPELEEGKIELLAALLKR